MSDEHRIGLCGGTFDPFHRGHLDPIAGVYDALEWAKVIFIPANRQPFKTDRTPASAFHRFGMAVLATEDDDRFEVSPMELERGEVSYTVDTLERVRGAHREATLDWIIGDDNLELLPKWRSLERIFELANFVVLRRGSHSLPAQFASRRTLPRERLRAGGIVVVDNVAVPISATEIRERAAAGKTIVDLVDARVERYIRKNGIYQE